MHFVKYTRLKKGRLVTIKDTNISGRILSIKIENYNIMYEVAMFGGGSKFCLLNELQELSS